MDNTEYMIKKDEIKLLISQKDYASAAEIADTIDWRRVRSVMMLCTVSDLYKINRRYEDARNMLYLAYDIRPGGRAICYSLCELCIKMEDYVQAVKYYREYVQVAPKDPDRYILQYKLYEAQDVSLEERIEVLKELKKRDYREKWAYELAYLYHRTGQGTLCVEECDELILWFGEGKYVYKAMELKMLHQPLSPSQKEKYDHRFDELQEKAPMPEEQFPIQQESVEETQPEPPVAETVQEEERAEEKPEEMDIQVKTVDVGQYNTINLQAELAAGLQEVLNKERRAEDDAITRAIIAPMLESDTGVMEIPEQEEEEAVPEIEEAEETEVFFGETNEIGRVDPETVRETANVIGGDTKVFQRVRPERVQEPEREEENGTGKNEEERDRENVTDETAEIVMRQMRMENEVEEQALIAQPPKEIASVLSQESDGQISLVVPEKETVEKQITGQLSIQDILTEWERMKQENAEKRREEVRQHVLEQTGNMFTEFEVAVRDNLLEQLKSGELSAEQQMEEAEQVANAEEQHLSKYAEAAAGPEKSEELEELEIGELEEEEPEIEESEIEELEIEEPEEEPETGDAESEELESEELEEEELEEEEFEIEELEEEAGAEELEIDELEEEPESEELEIEELEEESGSEDAEPKEADIEEADIEETDIEEPETEETESEEEPESEELTEEPETAEEEAGQEHRKIRRLTREERELFGPFVQSRAAREQLVTAIDAVSMAAYTGNVIVTGEEGMDTLTLAKNIIREIQMTDRNFSGKIAKISGQGLNSKDVQTTIEQLKNGALIVQKASDINSDTAASLHKVLQQESLGIIIVLEDTKKGIARLFADNPQLQESFTARMDIQALSNDMLVAFGKQYAREKEYSIDELGVLALHTRIERLQTIDHVVTVMEVKDILDEAIRHANRKTMGHFVDVLLARRYDEEDMIILTEKDFV